MTTYGDSSPMALLWTFMGFSSAYEMFAGASEVLAGLLLFARRTTTLGALLAAGVMANIVMMNFCFDVPVKLFSSHLLLMALFLLLPDLRRLADFLVFNRPAQPANLWPVRAPRWVRLSQAVLGMALAGVILYSIGTASYGNWLERGNPAARPPLYGLYDVEEFSRDGQDLPPLTTNANRWRRVFFSQTRRMVVRMMDDSRERYDAAVDTSAGRITVSTPEDPSTKFVFTYSKPDDAHLILEGRMANATLGVRLRKIDVPRFFLTDRGFHWINEAPLNK